MSQNEHQEDETIRNNKEQRPIVCQHVEGRFVVTHVNGNSLDKGGFGYYQNSQRCLYIEEVMYLHEKGLLWCYDSPDARRLELPDFYALLEQMDVPLAVVLVYQHARSQTFRVVRHTDTRQAILLEMEQHKQATKGSRIISDLRQQLRQNAATAPTPVVNDASIAFDCYLPNSKFASARPGLPDFHIAIFRYEASCCFSYLQTLLNATTAHVSNNNNNNVPLKVATVSDSGTVVLFGVTDYGVPDMRTDSS